MIVFAWKWFQCLVCGRTWIRETNARICPSCRGEMKRIDSPLSNPEPYSPAWLEARALTALIVRG